MPGLLLRIMRPLSPSSVSTLLNLVLIALLMRRFCFLLLAFLFPLQLFAGTLEPVANSPATADESIVMVVDAANHDAGVSEHVSAEASASDAGADPDPWQAQADLEDQTLPVPVATLPLDWQPFPHLYPHVSGGESAFIGLLRPPPAV